MSDAEEIFAKMENQHRLGQHSTGPQAGCPICEQQLAAPIGGSGTPDDVEAAAAVAQLAAYRAAKEPQPSRRSLIPSTKDIASWGDERTLGDVALSDCEDVLGQLDALGRAVPPLDALQLRATVAQVRALASIEQQLGYLVAVLMPDTEEVDEGLDRLREAIGAETKLPEFVEPPELTDEQLAQVVPPEEFAPDGTDLRQSGGAESSPEAPDPAA